MPETAPSRPETPRSVKESARTWLHRQILFAEKKGKDTCEIDTGSAELALWQWINNVSERTVKPSTCARKLRELRQELRRDEEARTALGIASVEEESGTTVTVRFHLA